MKVRHPRALSVSVAVVIFGTWAVFWFSNLGISNPTERGQFGDKFGALNALFTGLALFGLIWTLIREAETKSELAQILVRLERQNAILEAQKTGLEEQNKRFLDSLYVQSVAAELQGWAACFEHARPKVGSDNNMERMLKLLRDLNFAKLQAAERAGVKGVE